MVKHKEKIVVVSGGFDPIHVGHTRLFKEAKSYGDKLIVVLNNDNWLKAKKGYVFMPQKERKEVIENIKWVDKVIVTHHKKDPADMSVCAELAEIKPDIFCNGGDRNKKNIPELAVCRSIHCKAIFGIGKGGKIQSSSWLINNILNRDKHHNA